MIEMQAEMVLQACQKYDERIFVVAISIICLYMAINIIENNLRDEKSCCWIRDKKSKCFHIPELVLTKTKPFFKIETIDYTIQEFVLQWVTPLLKMVLYTLMIFQVYVLYYLR